MQLLMDDQRGSIEYLGITEAAEYLRVSASTLRRWEKKGFLIPERTPTGIRRYTKNQLDAVLQQTPQFDGEEDQTAYASYPVEDQPPIETQQPFDVVEPPADEPVSHFTPPVAVNNNFNQFENDNTFEPPSSPSTFVSSHRQTPPPGYDANYESADAVQNTTFQHSDTFTVRFPVDEVQSTLNTLSQHEELHYPPTTAYTETVSFDQEENYAHTDNTGSSYTKDSTDSSSGVFEKDSFFYAGEEELTVFDHQHSRESVDEESTSKTVSKKVVKQKNSGLAMFMGLFVGILLLTAGIWFGYVYLSGGFSTQALLSPVP